MSEKALFVKKKINFLCSKKSIIPRYTLYEISLKSSNYKILKHDFSKTENFSLSMEELLLTIFKRSKMIKNDSQKCQE